MNRSIHSTLCLRRRPKWPRRPFTLLVASLSAGLLTACPPPDGNDAGGDGGDQPCDGGAESDCSRDAGGVADGGGILDAGGLLDGGGLPDGGGMPGDLVNPWGFSMRVPTSREIACEVDPFSCPDGTFVAWETDYVCSLTTGSWDAVVYVRATPTGLAAGGFPYPIYDDVQAFLHEGAVGGGTLTEVPAAYDFGGNHNNDFFTVTLDDGDYTFDHSSYGFGFRVCQPPDCLRTQIGETYTDGCQPERTLPEACIAVADPLPEFVDNFALCAGDEG